MTYYSTCKTILNGEPQPATNKYGDRRQMERQLLFPVLCSLFPLYNI